MNYKLFILSSLLLVVAFALAANSTDTVANRAVDFAVVETNWGFVCMSATFTVAGVKGIGYSLLRAKDKS
jgi:hypothetical protein